MSNCNCVTDCGENCKCKQVFTDKEKEVIAKSAIIIAKGDKDKALKLISSKNNIAESKQAKAIEIILLIDSNYKSSQVTEINDDTLLPLTSYLWARSQYKQLGVIMHQIPQEKRTQVTDAINKIINQKSLIERIYEHIHD